MDTNSKKYHKTAVGLITVLILCASLVMTLLTPTFMQRPVISTTDLQTSQSFLRIFIRNNYVLDYQEKTQTDYASPYDIFFEEKDYPKKEEATETVKEQLPSERIQEKALSQTPDTDNDMPSAANNDYYNMLLFVEERYNDWKNNFQDMLPYLDYEVLDETRTKTLKASSRQGQGLYKKALKNDMGDYAFIISIEYNDKGVPAHIRYTSNEKDYTLKELTLLADADPFNEGIDYYQNFALTGKLTFQKPVGRTYTYAMTGKNLAEYFKNHPQIAEEAVQYVPYAFAHDNWMLYTLLILSLVVVCCAFFLPRFKRLDTGEEKIFHAPLELILLVGICALYFFIVIVDSAFNYGGNYYNFEWLSSISPLRAFLYSMGIGADACTILINILIFIGYAAVFALVYWAAACIRRLFTLGVKGYFEKNVLTYRFLKHYGGKCFRFCSRKCRQIYQSFLHVDLTENTTRMIIKAVLINFFVIFTIICCILLFGTFGIFGIFGIIVYSVVLFFLLRKYCDDLKKQYQNLLIATNDLAKGNLNGTIPEDLGVFEPFREEIAHIQEGFQKAVDEEVKSTRMKTDLITNVSHDLKTPLTAIITYTDLLKQEDCEEEERRKYIEILDQKANRLKVLIDDLFEVSKATSKAITLNMTDIDIVSLLKQVKLELQDKLDTAELVYRWQLPEEKIILKLDSLRTYRIFENLLVNITKYAMPHTRAFIILENIEESVKIKMKNISANELDFNPNEITERFVRGDVARSTEGSGLGLAIAKNFTELQGGKFEIFTDADLFTVEITFLK